MSDTTAVELEIQQRGEAFSQARKRLERKYNCTVTIRPKWLPGVSGTWVLGFDEQVMVGPVPAPPQAGLPAQAGMRPIENEGDA